MTAAGASAGATIGSVFPGIGNVIGAVVGAVVGFVLGVFGNNDNGVIKARDNIVKSFRASNAAYTYKNFPIKKENGGNLFTRYKLEHSQVKDRKIGGDYNKEWKAVCEMGGELLFIMYPYYSGDAVNMYAEMLKGQSKPDHAFAAVVKRMGKPVPTPEQLKSQELNKYAAQIAEAQMSTSASQTFTPSPATQFAMVKPDVVLAESVVVESKLVADNRNPVTGESNNPKEKTNWIMYLGLALAALLVIGWKKIF